MKAQQNRASDQMKKITDLLCEEAMTAMELSRKLDISPSLVSHYIRKLTDMGYVKLSGMDIVGSCNARAKVWIGTMKFTQAPKPERPKRININSLTRWVGGNPFERITT